jgi:hypothetical protein
MKTNTWDKLIEPISYRSKQLAKVYYSERLADGTVA